MARTATMSIPYYYFTSRDVKYREVVLSAYIPRSLHSMYTRRSSEIPYIWDVSGWLLGTIWYDPRRQRGIALNILRVSSASHRMGAGDIRSTAEAITVCGKPQICNILFIKRHVQSTSPAVGDAVKAWTTTLMPANANAPFKKQVVIRWDWPSCTFRAQYCADIYAAEGKRRLRSGVLVIKSLK